MKRPMLPEDWMESALLLSILMIVLVIALSPSPATAQIPVRADGYAKLLQREAVARFGLRAPVALLGAQLHAESHWRADAQSDYAAGLAQFTPVTAQWIPGVCPDVGPPDVWDPRWSIRAQACFMHFLYVRVNDTASECDRWAMVLSAYNGGAGNLAKDRLLASATGADPARWWGHVELRSARAEWAFRENRAYPRRILFTLEPLYLRAGWPGARTCTQ